MLKNSKPDPPAQHHRALGTILVGFPYTLLHQGAIQTKLAINQPGDEYEQEADRISEQVMRMPGPQSQRACACGGACHERRADQLGQEQERLQTKRVQSSDVGQSAALPIVHEVLGASGQPLDSAIQGFMGPRFGHDFSDVRVHTDVHAAESAQAVGARAYTVGRHIVFAEGQYDTSSQQGKSSWPMS
jgi:Domain of unknown function (DUF4157)